MKNVIWIVAIAVAGAVIWLAQFLSVIGRMS